MFSRRITYIGGLFFCLLLGGCFDPAQNELLEKVRGANTPSEIETAIGKPDEIHERGALKIWRYYASGGDICFSAVGSIALRMVCPQ
ncbi:hypothetical protein [Sneathiella glossodoripedis]|uniref:hypothetical protein n=1 Tax=Sneathiella glossodoripedis TaxID=418853 RepID=UPI0004707F23|nr:hypothetical protein [Sneathiella glossodoripedis]